MTEGEREAILADLRSGMSVRATAREHGRDKSTVSALASKAGVAVDGTQTAAATERRMADLRDSWVSEAEAALQGAQRLRGQLFAGGTVYTWHQGEYREQRVDQLPAGELRNLAVAYAVLVDKSLALQRHGEFEQRLAELEQAAARAEREDTR